MVSQGRGAWRHTKTTWLRGAEDGLAAIKGPEWPAVAQNPDSFLGSRAHVGPLQARHPRPPRLCMAGSLAVASAGPCLAHLAPGSRSLFALPPACDSVRVRSPWVAGVGLLHPMLRHRMSSSQSGPGSAEACRFRTKSSASGSAWVILGALLRGHSSEGRPGGSHLREVGGGGDKHPAGLQISRGSDLDAGRRPVPARSPECVLPQPDGPSPVSFGADGTEFPQTRALRGRFLSRPPILRGLPQACPRLRPSRPKPRASFGRTGHQYFVQVSRAWASVGTT